MAVAPVQRFTPQHSCPVCAGHERLPRGNGKRCHGFLSADGRYAHCSREERAGGLALEPNSDTYAHKLHGHCNCGERHDRGFRPVSPNGHGEPLRIAAIYDYRDADRAPLYQVVRLDPKDFRQRRPDGAAGWVWKLDGVPRVLYRLPELLAAGPDELIFIPEGEKDVDQLSAIGAVATTNVGGAGKWRDEYTEALRGRHVVILPDNDGAGRRHAEQVAAALVGVAASVRVVALPGLPPMGDVSDWLAAGGDADRLAALVAGTPPFTEQRRATQGKRAGQGFTLTRLADLLAEPPEAVAWVVDGLLIAGGVSILGAKPKVGKSTLARNIALAVARGTPFFGRAAAPGAVVYLALEEKRAEVGKHFARMGAGDEPIVVHVGSAPEEALGALTAALAEHRPALAIVDPLLKLVRLRDANDYAEVSRALEPLLDLARATGCHLLCLHHLGKGERSGGDAVLGSTALFGAVDTLLLMKRAPEGQRTIETIQRYGDDLPATVVRLDPETGLVAASGDVAALKLAEAGKAVLEALGDETLTEADIRERGGGNQSLASKALRALVDEGRVARSGNGKRNDPYLYSVARPAGESLSGSV